MNNQLYKDIIRHRFCKGENDMANYYRVAYKESKNTLKQICELFRVDSSDITIKFIVTVMGPLVFYFMCKYGNPGGGTPGGMTFFVIKYIVVWALAKKTRSFSYKDVTKILETKEAFGVVVKADPETVGSARAMIGFPKTALEGNNTDELAEFLLERCGNMKRKKVKKF